MKTIEPFATAVDLSLSSCVRVYLAICHCPVNNRKRVYLLRHVLRTNISLKVKTLMNWQKCPVIELVRKSFYEFKVNIWYVWMHVLCDTYPTYYIFFYITYSYIRYIQVKKKSHKFFYNTAHTSIYIKLVW